jgi:hypothetical protein
MNWSLKSCENFLPLSALLLKIPPQLSTQSMFRIRWIRRYFTRILGRSLKANTTVSEVQISVVDVKQFFYPDLIYL